MRTFGEFKLKTMFINVLNRRIQIIENPDGTFLYRRDETSVLLPKRGTLKILPAPAEGYGVKFLMVRFKPEVALPPEEVVTGYTTAPVDVVVKSGNTLIDRFVIGREKYALYGERTIGVIARYHVGEFTSKEPDEIGIIKLVLRNPTSDWKLVGKVVIPIRNSVMFYSDTKAYYPLIILTTKEPYEVNNTGNPPDGMLKPTHRAEPLPNFRMRW
ncbi:DUF432 domain-containing protein [Thermococcus sp.]